MDSQPIDSSRLSSYFPDLAEKPERVVSSGPFPAELRRAFGPWVSVTAAAAKAAFALADFNTAAPVVDLVVALTDAGDAQTELLKSIKADTLLLRQEPFRTAITLMGEAERAEASDERVQFLKDAVASLLRATNLAPSSGERAVVYFGLACAYLALANSRDNSGNDSKNAQHWIEESVKSEREVLAEFLRKPIGVVDERTESRKQGFLESVAAAFLSVSPRFALRLEETIARTPARPATKRDKDFRRFLHFANAVEISEAAISGRPKAKVLDFKPSLINYRLYEETFTLPVRKSPDI